MVGSWWLRGGIWGGFMVASGSLCGLFMVGLRWHPGGLHGDIVVASCWHLGGLHSGIVGASRWHLGGFMGSSCRLHGGLMSPIPLQPPTLPCGVTSPFHGA